MFHEARQAFAVPLVVLHALLRMCRESSVVLRERGGQGAERS